jgi:hypothetical protein
MNLAFFCLLEYEKDRLTVYPIIINVSVARL